MARTRAKTAARGYGGEHARIRAQWEPVVDAGQAACHATRCLMTSRWIVPGTPWNLGHAPDRSAYTGPEHERCNKSEGASRGNRMRRQQPPRWITSRHWLEPTCRTCGKPTDGRASRICEICGAHYHPNYGAQRTCGRACGLVLRRTVTLTLVKHERHRPAGRTSCPIYVRPCEHCSELFTGRTKASRYCSRRCADTAYNHIRRGTPQQHHCACGMQLPAGREKCDDCRSARATRSHKAECRHEGC